MKNLTLLLLLGLFISVNAQTKYFETDIQGIRKDIAEVAKEIVAENMELTPDQAKIFWPIYDEYRVEMKLLGDKEIELTEEVMLNYYAFDEDIASRLLEGFMDLERDKISLKNEYIRKMKKALPSPVVARYYQLENRLNLLISAEKASRFPLLKTK
jgi:hypothetical protein